MLTLRKKIRLWIIVGTLFAGFIWQTWILVLINTRDMEQLRRYADRQYHKLVSQPQARGCIYDRHGKLLAGNRRMYSSFCIPFKVQNDERFMKFLYDAYPQAYQRINEKPDMHFCYVKRFMEEQEMQQLRTSEPLQVQFLQEYTRYYPMPSFVPVIGVVDSELKGLAGLEYEYEDRLHATPSLFCVERDARGQQNVGVLGVQIEGREGKNIQTTLDLALQFFLQEEIKKIETQFQSREACALIMDAERGDILAMGQTPFYESNFKGTTEDLFKSLKNKCIGDSYEMGSVIKAFCALAALAEKVVDVNEMIDCKNTKEAKIGAYLVKTTKAQGVVSFKEVLKASNNIGIVQVGMRLGEKLYDHYRQMGFGQKTGISLPGEAGGFIMPPDRWSKKSIYSLSFGYEIMVTPLQLARAWSLLPNCGSTVRPRILLQESVIQEKTSYSPDCIDKWRVLMDYTDDIRFRALVKQFPQARFFGKTGTANILEEGVYNPDKNTYAFVGHIEYFEKKWIIVIYIREANKKDLYAATVALPAFISLAQVLLERAQVRSLSR